jgi:hypothetical protein
MQNFTEIVEFVASIIDGAGVAVIVFGLFIATFRAARLRQRSDHAGD